MVAPRLGAPTWAVFALDEVGSDAVPRPCVLGNNPLAMAGLRELRLGPLDPQASAALLDAHAVLDPVTRHRVLEEAAGNPWPWSSCR